MKTVLCDDGQRREIWETDLDGTPRPSMICPVGINPKPRAKIAPRGWEKQGPECGPKDRPMQWWQAR